MQVSRDVAIGCGLALAGVVLLGNSESAVSAASGMLSTRTRSRGRKRCHTHRLCALRQLVGLTEGCERNQACLGIFACEMRTCSLRPSVLSIFLCVCERDAHLLSSLVSVVYPSLCMCERCALALFARQRCLSFFVYV